MLEICMLVQECLAFGFQLEAHETEHRESLMDEIIDIQDHPNMDPNQSAFLSRPAKPVYVVDTK